MGQAGRRVESTCLFHSGSKCWEKCDHYLIVRQDERVDVGVSMFGRSSMAGKSSANEASLRKSCLNVSATMVDPPSNQLPLRPWRLKALKQQRDDATGTGHSRHWVDVELQEAKATLALLILPALRDKRTMNRQPSPIRAYPLRDHSLRRNRTTRNAALCELERLTSGPLQSQTSRIKRPLAERTSRLPSLSVTEELP